MATTCHAFRDNKGNLHSDADKATVADLTAILGRVGQEEGLTSGVARLILDKRADIERIFAEHDAIKPRETAAEVVMGLIAGKGR